MNTHVGGGWFALMVRDCQDALRNGDLEIVSDMDER